MLMRPFGPTSLFLQSSETNVRGDEISLAVFQSCQTIIMYSCPWPLLQLLQAIRMSQWKPSPQQNVHHATRIPIFQQRYGSRPPKSEKLSRRTGELESPTIGSWRSREFGCALHVKLSSARRHLKFVMAALIKLWGANESNQQSCVPRNHALSERGLTIDVCATPFQLCCPNNPHYEAK